MPAKYVRMRDELIDQGVPEDEAQSMAAMMYNDTRTVNDPELTPDYDKKHPYKGGRKVPARKVTQKAKY